MVIHRESPRKPPPPPSQAWPPRSPLDALLSSPRGRKKYENRLARNSTSPSPSKRRRMDAGVEPVLDGCGNDDDEDEETLQLQLQAIEAKLKLKKLQQAKAKSAVNGPSIQYGESSSSRPGTATSVRNMVPDVKIPVSPIKRPQAEQTSPARVLLGIDKGLRAQDVSLKRASSTRTTAAARTLNSQLLRSNSTRSVTRDTSDSVLPRPKSFGERIAEARSKEKELQAKQERISNARTHGFGLELSRAESNPRSATEVFYHPQLGTLSQASKVDFKSHSASNLASKDASSHPNESSRTRGKQKAAEDDSPSTEEPNPAATTLEPYTGFHLSNRRLDHNHLTRALQEKTVYCIPRLLKEVKSPDYEPPDCESDYVIVGIIASKSTPLEHRTGNPKTIDTAGRDEHARPKFMVIRLTDLKWELDLFLFDTGFDAFWKLTPGTVIAVLNPGIMPPKDRATGSFSLKLTSSEDSVLEIGTAKDLGFCTAIKGNGKECLQWIDGRKTSVCEFHMSLKVDQARKGRMQLNTMVGMGKGSQGGRGGRGGTNGLRGGRGGGNGRGLKAEGKTYDSYLHETLYLAPKESGFSATRLLDDRDADVNAWQRGYSREEMQRRKQKEREKEAELAKKLGALGGSAGSEYLKSRADEKARKVAASAPPNPDTIERPTYAPIDAQSLGLLGKRADDVSLNAVKRKRGNNSGSSAPMGWSSAFKTGLPSPTKSARKDPDQVSPKKKARFMLAEKGLREPGRESLGNIPTAQSSVDYDDDLEIV